MNPQHHRTKRAVRKVALREFSVRKAKPKASAYLIWDAKQRGLALRIQPTGTKAWVVVYSRQGRSRWLYIGDANTVGLADARIMAGEAMLAVAKGTDPAAERKAERSKGTFEELAAKYVEEYAKKFNKSWKQAEALVSSHALPRLGKLQATSITRDDIKTMMSRITATAPILANQVVAAVSKIFSWAIKEEKGFTANPCKLVDRNPTKARERVLSESEVPVFWQALDGIDDAVQAAALRTILLLGQRPGECAHMRREHIKDNWWQMPGEEVEALGWPGTKNGESHRVWIPKPVLDIITSDKTTGFVFSNSRGRPIHNLDAVMRKISAKLGVEKATPHDLRRTHGTTVTKLKFGRDAMNRVQNHVEGGIASVYDRHEYADENKNIMETVATHIMGLVEGRSDDGKVVRLAERRKA